MKSQLLSDEIKAQIHKIRTPMNAILGFSRIANSDFGDSKPFSEEIYKAALKLQGVLDEITGLNENDYKSFELNTSVVLVGKVLVVDDDKNNRRVAKLLLNKMGLKVDMAESGVEALKAVTRKQYDLVLMDLQMPGADGFVTSKVIRNKNQDLPIIALTADLSPDARKRCREVGMVGFLTKPIVPKKLKMTLAQWLSE